jgi:hypothetical protein
MNMINRDISGRFIKGHKKNPIPGIYKITNILGAVYVGKTRDLYKRERQHKRRSSSIPELNKSFDLYGRDGHLFEVIHELPLDVTKEILANYERLYIDLYVAARAKLLNINFNGAGGRPSDASIKKAKETWARKINSRKKLSCR